MQFAKKFIMALLCLLIFVGFIGTAQANKSVFIISKHLYEPNDPSKAEAFSIDGDEIQKQTEMNASITCAVGLALDPDSATLFVDFDGSSKLDLINAKTMTGIDTITAPHELAGLVFDQSKQKLYKISDILFDLRRSSGIIKYSKGVSGSRN